MRVRCEEGQGLMEYSLVILFVVIIIVVALSLLSTTLGSIYSSVLSGFGGT